MDIIKAIESEQMKNTVPKIKVGNTVRVHARIKEGNKSRIQVFEGTIIKIQNGGVNQTFTVRRISYGVGVEKTFLIHSPNVEKIELVRVGKARRAKLNYLRDRVGKKAKTKEQVGARIKDEEVEVKKYVVVPETEAEEMTELAIEEVEAEETDVKAEEKAENKEAKEEKVEKETKKEDKVEEDTEKKGEE